MKILEDADKYEWESDDECGIEEELERTGRKGKGQLRAALVFNTSVKFFSNRMAH